MQYPLVEKIGPPELLVGRAKEFTNFNLWLAGIPDNLSKSRVILARRKSGKTSFVQRIFNQLWSQNGKVIPFYLEVLELDTWYPRFAVHYYQTFASQFISFLEREPRWVEYLLSLDEIYEYAIQNNMPEMAADAQYMLKYEDTDNGERLWRKASYAPHRYASVYEKRFLVILDEFQNISFHIFRDPECQTDAIHSMPGSYISLAESKVAPMLVTGSYIGILLALMHRYLKGGRLSVNRLSPYLAGKEGLQAVYQYARLYNVAISNRSAAQINELCMADPFLISCVLLSNFEGKDLTTQPGVIQAVDFELSNRESEMSGTWAEYLDMTFEKVNGINTKKLMLFLNKNNGRLWTPAEIKKTIDIDLDEFEIKKRLILLAGSDVILRDSSDIHFRGLKDGTLNQVLRHRFEEEVDGIAPDFKKEYQERLEIMEKDRNKWRGRANHLAGMIAEHMLAIELRVSKYVRVSDYFTGGISSDHELNLIDVQERVPYRYSDGRSEEIDIVAKSDDGHVLMIEVRKRQQATGIKAVRDLRDNAVDYAQQHDVTVLPAFLSLGGFTKKALEFCTENDIAIAQEIDFYGSE